LHRRKHQSDIGNARHSVRILRGNIAHAAGEVDTHHRRITNTHQAEADATAILAQRPQFERELGTIDDQLANDLRARTRIASLDQPNNITALLGHRPAPGPSARTWDHTAGRLAQHQAAFDLASGLGPHPRWDRNNAYTRSRKALTEAIAVVRPAPTHRIEIELPGIEL